MYEPSKHLSTFNVAGFQHWDGALVLGELKPGQVLELTAEPDNPFDPNAMAISFKGAKLGYIPRSENEQIALLSFYGHKDVFECRVLKVDSEDDPWHQVLVGIYVTDAR